MSPDSSRPQRVILVFTKNSKSFQINQWYYPSCKNLDILILNSLLSSLEKRNLYVVLQDFSIAYIHCVSLRLRNKRCSQLSWLFIDLVPGH